MAKKKVKPTYIPKEQRKASAKAKKPPMAPEMKRNLIIGGSVLVVALILFAVFYHGDNLPVKNGQVEAGDNWIVSNLSTSSAKRYYKLGEVNAVAGFTRNTESSSKTDTNETDFVFAPDDEASPIKQVYITGVKEKPRAMAEAVQPQFVSFYGEGVGEVKTTEINEREAVYFVSNMTETTETAEKQTQSLTCYLPAVRNASILISVMTTEVTEESPALTDEELLEVARTFAKSIVFETK